jgi:hypothetical protein
MPKKCHSLNLPSAVVPNECLACTSPVVLNPSLRSPTSIVDCLKKLCATKGSRIALKTLDYDNIKHSKVDYLPPVFNGDLVFEFPFIGSSSKSFNAKLMVGMDKQNDGHAWTRTNTFHIKNDMGLTFHTASYVGHLCCDN